jgi:hypothetical protein
MAALYSDLPDVTDVKVAGQIRIIKNDAKDYSKVRMEVFIYRNEVHRTLKFEGRYYQRHFNNGRRRLKLDSVSIPDVWRDFVEEQKLFIKDIVDTNRIRLKSGKSEHPARLTTPRQSYLPAEKPEDQDATEKQSARQRISLTGRLEKHGWGDKSSFGKKHSSYFVDIAVENLGGVIQREYGNDLERAIKAANATTGNRVKLTHVGERDVRIPDKNDDGDEETKATYIPRKKKIYEVTVLS